MSSISTDFEAASVRPERKISTVGRLATFPWWTVAMATLGIIVVYLIASEDKYAHIFSALRDGVRITMLITFTSYMIAIVIGIIIGTIRSKTPHERSNPVRIVAYHLATFYVEIFRGLPILVVLLITTFVVVPKLIDATNAGAAGMGLNFEVKARDISYTWRAIIALGLCYGAFLSEIFRAGIQSISKGQHEAAHALGLNKWQTLRFIVLPQAVRRVLPPLGNDLIAMLKDSSLVAILAVRDITQLAKLSAGQSFLYMETYLVAASIYLFMTVMGSFMVRLLEDRMGESSH
jgi:polar amino acid transport system permease protein